MNQVLEKKINLLIQLANADGHFDVKEKAFIKDLLAERGVDHKKLEAIEMNTLNDIHTIVDKEQALYWTLQLARVDGVLHPDELAFCKAVAFRLKFLPEVVDVYSINELPEFNVFKREIDRFRTFSVRD
jgi:uncharacterized membrane protein YebE (DUF533 family)